MNRPKAFLAWAIEMFGPIAMDRHERACRFLEEALELAQAEFISTDTVDAIKARVYARKPGTTSKEIGQCMATLEMMAENLGHDADGLASFEFIRVKSIPKAVWLGRHNAKADLGIAGRAVDSGI